MPSIAASSLLHVSAHLASCRRSQKLARCIDAALAEGLYGGKESRTCTKTRHDFLCNFFRRVCESRALAAEAHNQQSRKSPSHNSHGPSAVGVGEGGLDERPNPCSIRDVRRVFVVMETTTMISQRLRLAIKNCGVPQYVLAKLLPVNHSTLSAWLCGISPVRRGDPRIVQLGSLVGVPARACFARPESRARATRRLRQQVASTVRRGQRRPSGNRLIRVHRDRR
jgi:hypothetical protein